METIDGRYGELRKLHIKIHAECVARRILPWYSTIPYESSRDAVRRLAGKLEAAGAMPKHEFLGIFEDGMARATSEEAFAEGWLLWCYFKRQLRSEAAVQSVGGRKLAEAAALVSASSND